MRVFKRLGSLQFDPLDVAGRNHDLVLLARIKGYRREWTDDLLYRRRALYETYNKGLNLVPTAELPWYRVSWDVNRERFERSTFKEHAALVDELLERIRLNGALASGDVAPREAIDWFWRPTNQVRAVLEALAIAGVLGLARRDGNRRVYELVERLFPPELLGTRVSLEEQYRHKLLSRYRAHGLLAATGATEVWLGTGPKARDRVPQRAELLAAGEILEIRIEGFRNVRHIPAADAHFMDAAEREVADGAPPGGHPAEVAFLAPLDPLMWDRRLIRDLFGFDYLWEVYVPAAKRRWGYYVLPVLYGDRFVGRIEPRIDRKAGVVRILGLWWEKGFKGRSEPGLSEALDAALEAHRGFAGVGKIERPKGQSFAPRP